MVDVAQIKTALRMSSVVGQHVSLRRAGVEFQGLCPFHADKDPSFTVNDAKGFGHCFACGWHGDVLDFIEQHLNMEKRAAIEYAASLAGLQEYTGPAPTPSATPPDPATADEDQGALWEPILPVPDDAPAMDPSALWNPKRGKQVRYRETARWAYRDHTGALLGYVIRYLLDGNKITPQITFCQHTETGERRWCVAPFPRPRPLFNLNGLATRPKAPVILVEGEKTAAAAAALFPKAVVVTWPGGTKAVQYADWQPLAGRNVVMVPDADEPGEQAAWGYYKGDTLRPGIQQLVGTACRMVIVDTPDDAPKGWDLADVDWTPQQAGEWLTEAVRKAQGRGARKPLNAPKPPEQPSYEAPPEPPPHTYLPDYGDAEPDHDARLKAPFLALGHYHGTFYYLPKRGRQVIELTAMAHRELNLLQLAPLSYWENTFPATQGNAKVDWKMAADACIGQCLQRGFYDAGVRIRGRGAWLDDGRSILHLGGSLIVDGVKMTPHSLPSFYTYQADHSVELPEAAPLENHQAHELMKICRQLTWENPRSAVLLAGWCVIAPVCGILNWRPHIWVTGSSGSGKTTVVELILKPIVGPIALHVNSVTTESGVRQTLKSDARPVIFDEAEAEDKQQAARMQAILDLCRAASAQSGAKIIKGTQAHKAQAFDIRSCFAFSSINTSIKHLADESRITLLVLRQRHATTEEEAAQLKQQYEQLKRDIVTSFTPQFSAGLLMRTLENLSTLRANIDTFVSAASIVLGSRRAADQVAPMLAGAYMLHSLKQITLEEAIGWLRSNDLREVAAATSATDDELRLFNFLITHRLRVPTNLGVVDRTVGELINAAYSLDGAHGITQSNADAELRRFGIRVDREGGFYVSTSADTIKRALGDTPWASNWARPLRMLKGADNVRNSITFSPGMRTRAIWLPLALVELDDEEPQV